MRNGRPRTNVELGSVVEARHHQAHRATTQTGLGREVPATCDVWVVVSYVSMMFCKLIS